jgi:hypothetical protein
MGVLRDFYAIGSVVFVGRSIVDLGPRQHGSDMIEPAALGKACIVGPYTDNFAEAMRKFLASEAMLVAQDEEALTQAVAVLLSTPQEAMAMGIRAERVVRNEQGATERHARVILRLLRSQFADAGVEAVFDQRPQRDYGPGQATAPTAPPLEPTVVTEIPPPPRKPSSKVVITSIGAVPVQPPVLPVQPAHPPEQPR